MIRKLKILVRLPADIWQALISNFPGVVGYRLRRWFWKSRLKHLGSNVLIDCGVYFQNPEYISIDDNSWIDRGVIILAGPDRSTRARRSIRNADYSFAEGEVHIGKNAHIAPNCIISGIAGVYLSDDCNLSAGVNLYSFTHHYRSNESPSDRTVIFGPRAMHDRQYMIHGPIFFGRNVGVALHAVILPGVSLGNDSFVAMNSVVMSSFEENSFVAGNPATRLRDRFKAE